MKRRDMIAALGSVVASVGLAGCSSEGPREPREGEVSMDFTYEAEEVDGQMIVNCSGEINSRIDGIHVIEMTAKSNGVTKTQKTEVDIVNDAGWATGGALYEYSGVFVFDEIASVTAEAEVTEIRNASSG